MKRTGDSSAFAVAALAGAVGAIPARAAPPTVTPSPGLGRAVAGATGCRRGGARARNEHGQPLRRGQFCDAWCGIAARQGR